MERKAISLKQLGGLNLIEPQEAYNFAMRIKDLSGA